MNIQIESKIFGLLTNDYYIIKKKLGTGGFSHVYLAGHGDKNYAIKIMNPEIDLTKLPENYLEEETKKAKMIKCDNVIRVDNYDEADLENTKIQFIVMEYVEGGALTTLIQSFNNSLPTETIQMDYEQK